MIITQKERAYYCDIKELAAISHQSAKVARFGINLTYSTDFALNNFNLYCNNQAHILKKLWTSTKTQKKKKMLQPQSALIICSESDF